MVGFYSTRFPKKMVEPEVPDKAEVPPGTPMASGVLTTLGDVHVLQTDAGSIQVHAVEVLVLQVRLTLLLPELDPADVAAAVKEVPL